MGVGVLGCWPLAERRHPVEHMSAKRDSRKRRKQRANVQMGKNGQNRQLDESQTERQNKKKVTSTPCSGRDRIRRRGLFWWPRAVRHKELWRVKSAAEICKRILENTGDHGWTRQMGDGVHLESLLEASLGGSRLARNRACTVPAGRRAECQNGKHE